MSDCVHECVCTLWELWVLCACLPGIYVRDHVRCVCVHYVYWGLCAPSVCILGVYGRDLVHECVYILELSARSGCIYERLYIMCICTLCVGGIV